MKISYNWLQNYFDQKLPPANELAEQINSHSFEIESIENVGNDTVLDVKVMPDRAHYALCHKGIAREIKAISGMAIKYQAEPKQGWAGSGTVGLENSKINKVEVKIEEKELCNRYMARRIDNISIGKSPSWLVERLEAIGARSINNIVDATNYVMLDIGQPLHAFDADKVVGAIVVRKAKKSEKIELLPESTVVDGKVILKDRSIELNETDLVIADDVGPIAIAGVKGGKRAEISNETKNIIIESANFNPVSVRRTSTRLNIRNDASKRFENEIIPELAAEAMWHVSSLIMDLCPSAHVGVITDEFVKKTEQWTVDISDQFVADKVGIPLNEPEIMRTLERIECDIIGRDGEVSVRPPLDRLDLKIPEDFADEVARIKGYENVESELPPKLDEMVPVDSIFYWSEKVKNLLVSSGFSEVLLYSLVGKGVFEIEHPLANDKSALRESIVGKVQESLKMNALNADLLGLEAVKIFEIGKVFPKEGEKTVLAIGVNQVKKKKGVNSETVLQETVNLISKELGLVLTGKITKNDVGAIIEFDFDNIVEQLSSGKSSNKDSIAELNFFALPKDQKYKPFSIYPFIVRDIAVFVPESISDENVWQAVTKGVANAGAEKLLVKHSLFDVFKKDGKISYAFRMIFQSYEKTLTDEEVNKIMESIYAEMKNKGWEVR